MDSIFAKNTVCKEDKSISRVSVILLRARH
jgi:hypothetical protein